MKPERLDSLSSNALSGAVVIDDYAEGGWYLMLKAWGLKPRVIHGYFKKAGYHSACICEVKGTDWVFCNAAGHVMTLEKYQKHCMSKYKVLTDAEVEQRERVYKA